MLVACVTGRHAKYFFIKFVENKRTLRLTKAADPFFSSAVVLFCFCFAVAVKIMRVD